jgi:replicative DNA helicase
MATAQVPRAIPAAHSIEAEESVLGAILLVDSSIYGIVIEQALKPEDFYREQHRIVFRAMVELYNQAQPIDTLTLVEHLRQTGHLDEIGGEAFIHRLAGPVPYAGNAPYYAQIVKDNALLRRLMTTTYDIQQRVANRESTPRELVEQAERAMLEVAHDDRQKDFRWIHDILDVELEKLQKLSKDGTALTGTPTGFKDLDALTGGFQPGNLIVIAARPAMGKCLAGSALVYDPVSGARRRIDDLVSAGERGEEVWVASLDSSLRLRPTRASAVIRSGVQSVYRLTTRLGRRVEATASHPLLTARGWRCLADLRGDRIAVPRRLPAPREVCETASHATQVAAFAAEPSLRGAALATGPAFVTLAWSDVWWDEVTSVDYVGAQETYDLTVPGEHNFVADDLIVHNSALVTNIAENVALDHHRAVALFSLEMSETELAQRFIASQARIKGDDLRKGRVADSKWPKILEASSRLANAPLYVDDSSDIGLLEIRAKSRRLHQREPLGMIIVDYLQLLRADGRIENRVEQVGQMSRGLKILARELDVPVVALSQLNRSVEARTDKRPLLSDLRESGAIEQDSDVVMFIYRDEYYNKESEDEGIAELIVSKHRNGPIDTVRLTFQKDYPKFMNYAGQRFET